MEEWILTSIRLPNKDNYVIANVEANDSKYIYSEIMCYNYNLENWQYHNGKLLEGNLRITAWKEGPSNLING